MRPRWLLLIALILTAMVAHARSADGSSPRLLASELVHSGEYRLSLRFSAPPSILRSFRLTNHNRIVIDLERGEADRQIRLNRSQSPVRGLRLGQHGESMRLVIDLDSTVGYRIEQSGNDPRLLVVSLQPASQPIALSTDTPGTGGTTTRPSPAASNIRRVSDLRCVPMLHGSDSCKDLLDGVAAGIEMRYSGANSLPPVELSLPGDRSMSRRSRGEFGVHRYLRNVQTGKRRKDVGYQYTFDGGELGLSLIRPALSYAHEVGDDGEVRMLIRHDRLEIGFQNRW